MNSKKFIKLFWVSIFLIIASGFIFSSCCGAYSQPLRCKEDLGGPKMSTDKKVYAPGEEIILTYTSRPEYKNNAWIGLIPSNIEHGKESENEKHDVQYRYIKACTGTMKFKAPETPGKYDFRMHDADSNGKEVLYISFDVK